MPELAKEEFMSRNELKALLLSAKIRPVACALGFTKQNSAVILLSRLHNPRKLEADLKRHMNMTTRFGHVSIDSMGLVTFTLNKEVSKRDERELIMALKGTGFIQVDCVVQHEKDQEKD